MNNTSLIIFGAFCIAAVLARYFIKRRARAGRCAARKSHADAYLAEIEMSCRQQEDNSRRIKERDEEQSRLWSENFDLREQLAREWGAWLIEQDPTNEWMVHDGRCRWMLFNLRFPRYHVHLNGGTYLILPPIEEPPEVPSLAGLQAMYLNLKRKD